LRILILKIQSWNWMNLSWSLRKSQKRRKKRRNHCQTASFRFESQSFRCPSIASQRGSWIQRQIGMRVLPQKLPRVKSQRVQRVIRAQIANHH